MAPSHERDGKNERQPLLESETGVTYNLIEKESVVMVTANRCLPKTTIIEPLILLYVLSWTCYMDAKHQFVYHATAHALDPNNTSLRPRGVESLCNASNVSGSFQNGVQSSATYFALTLKLVGAVPNLVAVFVQTSLSDSFGRRAALLVSLSGSGAAMLLFFIVVRFQLPLTFLYAGEALHGLSGNAFAVASAYMADVTSSSRRTMRLTTLEMGRFLSIGVASFAIHEWLADAGEIDSSMLAFILSLLSLALVYVFCLEESVPSTSSSKRLGLCANLSKCVRLLRIDRDSLEAQRKKTRRLFETEIVTKDSGGSFGAVDVPNVPFLLAFGAFVCSVIRSSSLETLYLMNRPFCWTPRQLGVYSLVALLVYVATSIGAARFLSPRFGDAGLAALSLLSAASAYAALALARASWMIWTHVALASFKLVARPTLRSMMSKATPADAYGSLYACVGVAELGADLIGASLFSVVYAETIAVFPGFVFVVLGLVSFVGCGLIIYLRCRFDVGTGAAFDQRRGSQHKIRRRENGMIRRRTATLDDY